ncbi:hypothetical protein MACJ_003709 [Theileria orientalis]|uniref:Uncharacterized protein n=1 Tax=Theileria orientalis TaxID=68886 RepID=A0A976XIY3_THEOR|nr:hypothetical protein MACJ_003709 [Theileria orientalis]
MKLSVYYNLYDSKHEFPLLLILEFNDKNKEYYKLIHEDSEHRTWAKFQGVEEENYLSKVKKLEDEMDELVKEINKLYSEIENLEARIQTSELTIQTLKEKSESNKGEESTTVNPKPAAQNGEQIETQEKTDEEKLKEEEENFKKLNQDKDNKTLEKSDKEKKLEEKKEALRVLLEQKAYWIMGSLGITFNKESPLFNPDMCKENNTGKGTIIGTLSTLTLIFGGIGGAIYKYPEVLIYNIPKILRWIQQIT